MQYMIYEKTGLRIDLKNPRWVNSLDDNTRDYLHNLTKDK